jgi:hypothetical protein
LGFARQCQNDLRDQIHREFVYRLLQFHKRRQLLIGAHNEALAVAAMRVNNPDRSRSKSRAETQPQLQPALLRLSATISQSFII